MPKFTLIAEHTDIYGHPTGHKVIHEFNVDVLDSVLENTDLFLRGVGFMPSGTLDYVQDEWQNDQEWYNEEFQTPNEPEQPTMGHSSFFYDTERNK